MTCGSRISALNCGAIAVFVATFWSAPLNAQNFAPTIHQTIHARTQTDLYVKVSPKAVCNLERVGTDDAARTIPVYADDRGIAVVITYLQEKGMTMNLQLDCKGENGEGSVTTLPIEVRSVPDFEPAISETDYLALLPPAGTLVQSLPGNPLEYSDKELEMRGYPTPRPDPTRQPGSYAE